MAEIGRLISPESVPTYIKCKLNFLFSVEGVMLLINTHLRIQMTLATDDNGQTTEKVVLIMHTITKLTTV